jgi:LuxR family maltose regulon positive regulatory protein
MSLAACNDDPRVLLGCVAAALDRIEPLDPSVVESLQSTRKPISSDGLPRLGAALSERSEPYVLALDDVGHLRAKQCAEALAVLAEHVPTGSCLALASRHEPPPLVARARARGLLFELGTDDLSFNPREARLLLDAEGIELGPEEELELLRKTEGWAAGLYLAARSFHDGDGSPDFLDSFGGDDRFVADYLRLECLSTLRPKELRFLTRSSVLKQFSASLCDAVLERQDSARVLEALERSRLFLVPLDHRREWFRYNRLFRGLLQAELARDEPQLVPELNRRAADWCEENSFLDEAIDHAEAALDRDRVARLVSTAALPSACGSTANAERWFGRLNDPAILSQNPAAAVLGSLHHALRGRPLVARRWADTAEAAARTVTLPDGSASIEPWLDVLRAARCQNGVDQMRIDAESALKTLPYDSIWVGLALVALGAAQLLGGDDIAADLTLAHASTAAAGVRDAQAQMVALAERSLLAANREDFETAQRLADDARSVAQEFELQTHATSAIHLAASARVALRRGDRGRAQSDLAQADLLVPLLTYAIPWFSAQTLLELARIRLALGQLDRGRALLGQADEIVRRSSYLGTLAELATCLEARSAALAESQDCTTSSLTAGELRLLPYLATHLSLSEIGGELSLSRNTIKTHAVAIYRKLGVSSRSAAVARAAEFNLVEDTRPVAHRRS